MDLSSVTENFEHLATTCKARAKMGQPLRGYQEGVVFDIVQEEYFDDFDDEEVFDDEILATFSECGPPLGITEDEEEQPQRKDKRWSTKGYLISLDFSEIQDQMKDLTTDGSIKKLILREGTGKKVRTSGKIFYHYMNFVEGSEEPFDTTLLGKYPSVADLRKARIPLLPGYEIALKSMELHEVAQFIISPELAYGTKGCPPRIPENCKILFVAEIVHCIDEELLNTAPYMTAEERAYLPFDTILKEVDKLCTMGNGHYEDGNFNYAIRKYRKARSMLEDYPTQNDEEGKSCSFWSRKLCLNIAQSYIRSNRPPQACVACKLGLKECEAGEDDAEAVGFFWRFAKAKLMLKDVEAAKGLIDQADKISPDNWNVRKLKDEIYSEKKIQERNHKAMCMRMFGNRGGPKPKPSNSKKQASTPVSDRKPALHSDNSGSPANQLGCAKKSGEASAASVTAKNLPTLQQGSEWDRDENKKKDKIDLDDLSMSTVVDDIYVDDNEDDCANFKNYKKESLKTHRPMFFDTF